MSIPALVFLHGVSRATIYRWVDLKEADPRFSRAELIEAALAWYARTGQPPTSAMWNRSLARDMGDAGITTFELWKPVAEGSTWRRWPDYRQVMRLFGSWPPFDRAVRAEIGRRREANDPYVAIEPPGLSRSAALLAQRSGRNRNPTRVPGGPMDRLYLEAVAEAVREIVAASRSPRHRRPRRRRLRHSPMTVTEIERWLRLISRK